MNKRLLIVAASLSLAACGGHSDSGGSSGAQATGTSGTSGNGTSVLTQTYEALPAPADAPSFLAQLNAEGTKGFRYIAEEAFSGDGNAAQNIFVKDSAATYAYDLLVNDATQAGFLAQANQEGAKGYRYEGPLMLGALYTHSSGAASAVYQYAVTASPVSAAAFLTSANAQGQSGYWYYGPVLLNSASAALFMKDSSSASTYTYDALAMPASDSDFVSQANGEGAKGYRYKGGFAFGTDVVVAYVKDKSQSPAFTYLAQPSQTTSAAFIQQANAQGAQSAGWLANLAFGSSAAESFYFASTNCSGFLCSVLNALTQN